MALINSDVIPAGVTTPYTIDQSLRFNDDDSAYLSWTPSSAGNRKTWTWSGWVKFGNLSYNGLFQAYSSGSALTILNYTGSGYGYKLQFYDYISGTDYGYTTDAVFRDPSAWYHIVLSVDTTQATASDRIKLYVNGVQQSFPATYGDLPQNRETYINSTSAHYLGKEDGLIGSYLDGYLAEVNFIDGQALDPTYFGKTGDYGEWKPIEYTGTYGTNGFYLPFKQDYQVEGFSTVTWTATNAPHYIGGVGFKPDLVWGKKRSASDNHVLIDSVRGATEEIYPNVTNAEATNSNGVTSFDTDGFTMAIGSGSGSGVWNGNAGSTHVAWCWDMGGSTVTNTNGNVDSQVRANSTYGQSIATYTGQSGLNQVTFGHGLSTSPQVVIIKRRDSTSDWFFSLNSSITGSWIGGRLNTASTFSDSNKVFMGGSVVTIDDINSMAINGATYVAYCFHSVSGYSKIGTYEGTGATGNSITGLGFKPGFLLIKNIDGADSWAMYDIVREPTNPYNLLLQAQSSAAEADYGQITSNSDGFTLNTIVNALNKSANTYIYMAFADTREFAYWLDQSGNNNDWTSNNLTESDISVDSPTNNFATLNSILPSATSTVSLLSEGSLKTTNSSTGSDKNYHLSTMRVDSGKWYMEYYGTSGYTMGGVTYFDASSTENYNGSGGITYFGTQDEDYSYFGATGQIYTNGSGTSYGATYGNGDIIGVALDLDSATNTVTFYKNNTSQGSYTLPSGKSWVFGVGQDLASNYHYLNFGQDSSFAGNKTAQGNTDSNEIGDFYYTPPSGYLALCTANLPDPAVIPSEHFNTVIWTGNNATSRTITTGFQPDLVWSKLRTYGQSHLLHDVVRGFGASKDLASDLTAVEGSTSTNTVADGYVSGTTSTGFTVSAGTDNQDFVNRNNWNYVAWNWKANGSGVSNTDGSITSTVSANQDAGFSIVSFTGNGVFNSSVGHGLTQKPELVILKNRDTATNWPIQTTIIDGSNDYAYLNLTNAKGDAGENGATNSVFYLYGNTEHGGSGYDFIAYCFHSVDGFSKVGSYTGNGSSDGTFVYTGFRPAFIMTKRTSSTSSWRIVDVKRSPYNNSDKTLSADSSSAEADYTDNGWGEFWDITSNGMKARGSDPEFNSSGHTYIYIAFAENPFKYTNAR